MRREVRRYPRSTSGRRFTPLALSGLRLWLRADLGVTIDTGVSTWANQAPSFTHDAVQADVTKQPAYSATSMNNRPGITADGSNDCLRIPAMTYGGADKVTIAFVAKDTSVGLSAIVEGLAGGGKHFSLLANPAAGRVRLYLEGAGTTNSGYFTDTLATPRRIIATYDYAIVGGAGTLEVAAWLDGVSQTLTQEGAQNNVGPFTDGALNFFARNDGAALPWAGTLGEVILYNRILSASEIQALDNYLKTQWGL